MAKNPPPPPTPLHDNQVEPPHVVNLLGSTTPFKTPSNNTSRVSAWVGKGGGGKTAGSVGLISLAQKAGVDMVMVGEDHLVPDSKGRSLIVYDLDPANPSVQRYLPGFPDYQVCGTIDVYEIGQIMQNRLLPTLEKKHHVIADIGAGAEVALLDWIEGNDLSAVIGDQLAFHVVLGGLDSVGTAKSIAERSPATKIILYLNQKEPEHRFLVDRGFGREKLDEVLALPNIAGLVDFPDLRTAFGICSRLSATLHDATMDKSATLIERQICRKAIERLDLAWSPARAWFPW